MSTTTADTAAGFDNFSTLYTAPDGTSIRGVAFAPTADVPAPGALALLAIGLVGICGLRRKVKTA